MELPELANQVGGFDQLQPRERIKLFAWFLHTHKNLEVVDNAAIRGCFSELHLVDPNVAKYLPRMIGYRDLMKVKGGYRLERAVRVEFDKLYGLHHSVVEVSKLLVELPSKVPNVAERAFLDEALKCYRNEAYRSCIVMVWNLAYSHLLDWILGDPNRLGQFNVAIPKRYPKRIGLTIVGYDQFLDELKESEVLEICNSGSIINSNMFKILKEKLTRRNIVAHPASVVVVQHQADDAITDLVNNVVLGLT
jgi:hypothetical protein